MSILDQIDKTLAESGFKPGKKNANAQIEEFELKNFSPSKIQPEKKFAEAGKPSSANDCTDGHRSTEYVSTDQPYTCAKCGSGDAWELLSPGGSTQQISTSPTLKDQAATSWRCLRCEPPAARWMVKRTNVERSSFGGRTKGLDAKTLDGRKLSEIDRWVSEGVYAPRCITLHAGRPVCDQCGSQVFVELFGRDGVMVRKCWSCRAEIQPEALEQVFALIEMSEAFWKR